MKNAYEYRGDTVAIKMAGPGGSIVEALISTSDFEIADSIGGRWTACDRYVTHSTRRDGKPIHFSLHRLIMSPQKHELIDHINGNKLDNRRSNLRIANASINALNKHRARRDSASGVRGVQLGRSGRWEARLKFGGKNLFLGSFDTAEEASTVYQIAHANAMATATQQLRYGVSAE